MKRRITIIRGDGTGPELAETAARVIDATGAAIAWDWQEAGEHALALTGALLPPATIDSLRNNTVALKAPITTPVGGGYRSLNVYLRHEFECFANVRPVRLIPGIASPYSQVDLVVIRENMEDLYAGIEYGIDDSETAELRAFIERTRSVHLSDHTAISIKPISVERTRAIATYAAEYARRAGRKKITIVHKANIMKATDGLFLSEARAVLASYPDLECADMIVDNCAMHLVRSPEQFDVLLCPNLYGDILSDLCAQLGGGIGIAPAGNIGTTHAVFEAVHGSAPRYAGLDKVNPTALVLAGAMMLSHIGENDRAAQLRAAVDTVIRTGDIVTYDLRRADDARPVHGTRAMGDAIIHALQSQ